jgi:hypothetical protein
MAFKYFKASGYPPACSGYLPAADAGNIQGIERALECVHAISPVSIDIAMDGVSLGIPLLHSYTNM